jgi:hypothetical protein
MQQVSQVMDFNCAHRERWSGNFTQLQGMVVKEQKRFYLEVTSTGMSHRDYFQDSNHHGFSFCDVVGTITQDLQDLFRRLFPNFERDQYLNSDLSVYIQEICKRDLWQVSNQ